MVTQIDILVGIVFALHVVAMLVLVIYITPTNLEDGE